MFNWDESADGTSFWNSIITNQDFRPYYIKIETNWFDKHFTSAQEEDLLDRIRLNILHVGNKITDNVIQKYCNGLFPDTAGGGFTFDNSIEGTRFWRYIWLHKDYGCAIKEITRKEAKEPLWIDKHFTPSEREDILNRCEENVSKAGNKWTDSIEKEYCKGKFLIPKEGGFHFSASKAISFLNNNSKTNQHVESTRSTSHEPTTHTISFEQTFQVERYSPTRRFEIPSGGCQIELAGRHE